MKLAENRLSLKGKDEMRDIDAYEAQSKRLTAETNAIVDLKSIDDLPGLKGLIQKTLSEMIGDNLNKVEQANEPLLMGGELEAGVGQ